MITSRRPQHIVLLTAVVLALGCGAQAKTQRAGKATCNSQHGIINIGQRRSLAEGNRASLRALARLIRRYPRERIYVVVWTVHLGRGPLTEITTLYARGESSVMRESTGGTGRGKPANRLVYDDITEQELLRVVRRGGSFKELERVTAPYSRGQQYWR